METRDSMIFYRSFYESLKGLSPIIRAEVYDAIFTYGLDFQEIDFTEPVAKAMFTLIKPQLDANIKRYENGNKPKNKQNVSENKQTISKTEGNDNVNDNVNENNNLNILLKKETKPKKSLAERKADFQCKVVDVMHTEKIDKILVKEFFDYWTETNQTNTKLKFEMEKTYDISRRLNTWVKNNEKFNINKNIKNGNSNRSEQQESAKQRFRESIGK